MNTTPGLIEALTEADKLYWEVFGSLAQAAAIEADRRIMEPDEYVMIYTDADKTGGYYMLRSDAEGLGLI